MTSSGNIFLSPDHFWGDATYCIPENKTINEEKKNWLKQWIEDELHEYDSLLSLKRLVYMVSIDDSFMDKKEKIAAFVLWRLLSRWDNVWQQRLDVMNYLDRQDRKIREIFGKAMRVITIMADNDSKKGRVGDVREVAESAQERLW